MKVCHLITRMIQGGAQENTLLTLEGLRRDTPWDLHLACGPETGEEGNLLSKIEALGIRPHIIPRLKRSISPWEDLCAYEDLLDYFRRESFDLVHTHSSKAGVLGRIAARRAGVPRIVHTIHGLAFDAFQPNWKNLLYIGAERFAAQHADMTVTVCHEMARRAVAARVANRSATRTIYSGFSLSPYLAVPRRPADGRFIIGIIARMVPSKGHEDLMRFLPQYLLSRPDVYFHIIGDGPMRKDWNLWLHLRPEWKNRLFFSGRVATDAVVDEIKHFDLLLHLSWREGLARVLPQALAAGRPVCSYNVGGASEVVIPDKTGWLLPVGDLNGVTRALDEARAHPELCVNRGTKGRGLVRALFDASKMQNQILKLYLQMNLL